MFSLSLLTLTVFGISALLAMMPYSINSCNAPVMPSSPLVVFLERVQSAALKSFGPTSFDPKFYVDFAVKLDLDITISAFDALPREGVKETIPAVELHKFVDHYLNPPGADLVVNLPVDFVENPEGFLPKVKHPEVRAWALKVHSLWKSLSRRVADEVSERPDLHTLLPLPNPVMIPGSRFREVYYWDSYWIVRGLLASKMHDTAKAIASNLLSLIETYGFVPNGARVYYTNRSQPPLLSSMVLDIYKRTKDKKFLKRALPSLLKEHEFWNSGIHRVFIQDAQGHKQSMSRYYAMWNKPRPESATIDEESSSNFLNDSQKEMFYREVASAAESGWDFSSRWLSNLPDLTTISTTKILPVDLNALIIKMENDISFLANTLGDSSISEKFSKASTLRWSAFNSIFWNGEMEQWQDYWLDDENCEGVQRWESHNQNSGVFASNFIPIWIDMCNSDKTMVTKIMKSLKSSGLLNSYGISTSLSNTGQQWDFPNGWPPIQHMIVEGLARSGLEDARQFAEDIAIRWIKTNYAAFKESGFMHEKYNVESCGKEGGGGEYDRQTGFGWSNGVVLSLLEEFGWPKDRAVECSDK